MAAWAASPLFAIKFSTKTKLKDRPCAPAAAKPAEKLVRSAQRAGAAAGQEAKKSGGGLGGFAIVVRECWRNADKMLMGCRQNGDEMLKHMSSVPAAAKPAKKVARSAQRAGAAAGKEAKTSGGGLGGIAVAGVAALAGLALLLGGGGGNAPKAAKQV